MGTVPGGVRAAPEARVQADGPVLGVRSAVSSPLPLSPTPQHQAAHFLTTVPTKK